MDAETLCKTKSDFVLRRQTIMTKASTGKSPTRRGKQTAGTTRGSSPQIKSLRREPKTGQFVASKARFEAVMQAAEQSGLLNEKGDRIGGRVSAALVRQAKQQTGIEKDTDLIEFALATVALEDDFADTFKESRGKVDPKLKLGF
jgi:hypothetical protein